jgi:hypothetical protein
MSSAFLCKGKRGGIYGPILQFSDSKVDRKLYTALATFGQDYILTAIEVRWHHWPSKQRWLKKSRGGGDPYHFLDLFSVNILITGDSISFGMYKYGPQFRNHYTEVNPKPMLKISCPCKRLMSVSVCVYYVRCLAGRGSRRLIILSSELPPCIWQVLQQPLLRAEVFVVAHLLEALRYTWKGRGFDVFRIFRW